MGRKASTAFLIIIALVGVAVLLYPTVSDWWNDRVQSKSIASYDETVAMMDEEKYEEMFEEAREYNKELAALNYPLSKCDTVSGYEEALDISGTGIMGYISIPKIDVELPFYHGTTDSVLSIAAGHLEGSSLPTGDAGTHAVIVAHRGLPSARLFSDLNKLKEGDTFTLTVLNRTMTYEIDQIKTVEPNETDDLAIEDDKEYVTLLTCTPYGINTERLLVRGTRAETTEETVTIADAGVIETPCVAIAIIIAGMMVLLIVILVKRRKKKRDIEAKHET